MLGTDMSFFAVFSGALSFTFLKSNMYSRKKEEKNHIISFFFPFSFSFPSHPLLVCLSALPLISFMFTPIPNRYLWLTIFLFSPYCIISIICYTKVTMRTEKICKIKSTCFLICSHLKTGVGWGGSKKSEPDKLCLLA